LKTQRLLLRERTRELLDGLISKSDEEKCAFFGVNEVARALYELDYMHDKNFNTFKGWDLIRQDNQVVIGSCSYHTIRWKHERAEVGYSVHPEHRKQGYMSEALDRIVSFGFKEMKLNRIEALTAPDNVGSIKLLNNLRFQKEGLLREHYKTENEIFDSIMFSLLKKDYFN